MEKRLGAFAPGAETGALCGRRVQSGGKGQSAGRCALCVLFSDTYEIGMSNLGMRFYMV